MKSLQDALYNWLSIKVVSDARPEDKAASETTEMFYAILLEEHKVADIDIQKADEMYMLSYTKEGQKATSRFPAELIDCMLDSIKENPERYKNYQ